MIHATSMQHVHRIRRCLLDVAVLVSLGRATYATCIGDTQRDPTPRSHIYEVYQLLIAVNKHSVVCIWVSCYSWYIQSKIIRYYYWGWGLAVRPLMYVAQDLIPMLACDAVWLLMLAYITVCECREIIHVLHVGEGPRRRDDETTTRPRRRFRTQSRDLGLLYFPSRRRSSTGSRAEPRSAYKMWYDTILYYTILYYTITARRRSCVSPAQVVELALRRLRGLLELRATLSEGVRRQGNRLLCKEFLRFNTLPLLVHISLSLSLSLYIYT